MKLMKLKLQSPSLAQAYSNVLGGAPAMRSQGHNFCKIYKNKIF